ncbi:hypothetical protein ACFQS7_13645 [Dankookia sp. GCM10030260]|uniref:hypothetical protein n=1 Tax=Dankookia sp. GCM10030260 TaxID=3273390 RepID=UPI00361F7A18
MADPMPPWLSNPTQPSLAPPAVQPAPPLAVVTLAAGREPVALLRGLCALALQRSREGLFLAPGAFGVVLVPNGPAAAVEGALDGLGPSVPFPVRITAPVPAGDWALRAGLDAALHWAGPAGVVLTTEAGAVPEAGWVAHAVAALTHAPLDAVLGRVVPPAGPDPAGRYAAALAAMAARLDPDPADPAPPHGHAAAASFAIRGAALRALGGLPVGPEGGLAGLLAALHRRDGRIRHLDGMRVEAALPPLAIEPAMVAWCRLRARRAVRGFWAAGIGVFERETTEFRRWAARLGLPAGALGAALSAPRFGEAWAAVTAASPVLAAPRRLPHSALPQELLRARMLLALARLPAHPWTPRHAAVGTV